MSPARRDHNLARIRNWTASIAGASLVATGLFAGLAASKAVVTKTVVVTKTRVIRTTAKARGKTTAAAAPKTVTVTAPAPTVTVTQSKPVATSGGS